MENSGFIKLSRKILEWEWFDDDNVFKVFMYILLMVNYEDKKWQGQIVERGSFITSIEHIKEKLKICTNTVRKSLSKLESTGEIKTIRTNKYTKIIVCNYNKYQDVDIHSDIHVDIHEMNNKVNTTKNIKNKRNNIYKPPTIEEVQKYIDEKQVNVDAKEFWNYYNNAEWTDRNGSKVKNWKLKLMNVWAKNNTNNTSNNTSQVSKVPFKYKIIDRPENFML